MKILKPSVEIIKQDPGIEGIYKAIEQAGRRCYQSQWKIDSGTAKPFVNMLIKSEHLAMLEHGSVYLQLPIDKNEVCFFIDDAYSKVHILGETGSVFISTNYRVIVENQMEHLLDFLVSPQPYHEQRITARFQCQIAISREFNRHRKNSMAEMSTRYVNFSKERHGKEIRICLPDCCEHSGTQNLENKCSEEQFRKYCDLIATMCDDYTFNAIDYWLFANFAADYSYTKLIECGWSAEKARTILPLDTATDLVHTAFISDWKHFFELRCDKAHAHPDAYNLATKLKELFIEQKYMVEE